MPRWQQGAWLTGRGGRGEQGTQAPGCSSLWLPAFLLVAPSSVSAEGTCALLQSLCFEYKRFI